jgi:hypothetical protein
MGREATCQCNWAGATGNVKALLETSDLILRGEIRKRIPFSELRDVKARSGRLCFTVAGDAVELFLGADQAEKWSKKITSPPPSLARKLGITGESVVRILGDAADESLHLALAEAARITDRNPDLILACVKTPKDLQSALTKAHSQVSEGVPLWLIYPKGPGHPLSESMIRSALVPRGLVDTKVAAVSAALAAIRFNARKEK